MKRRISQGQATRSTFAFCLVTHFMARLRRGNAAIPGSWEWAVRCADASRDGGAIGDEIGARSRPGRAGNNPALGEERAQLLAFSGQIVVLAARDETALVDMIRLAAPVHQRLRPLGDVVEVRDGRAGSVGRGELALVLDG